MRAVSAYKFWCQVKVKRHVTFVRQLSIARSLLSISVPLTSDPSVTMRGTQITASRSECELYHISSAVTRWT